MPYHLRKEPPVSTEVEDGWDTSALDMVAKRKILASARNGIPMSQPVASYGRG